MNVIELSNELENGEIDANLVSDSPIARRIKIKLSLDGLTQEKLDFIKTAVEKQIPKNVIVKEWEKDMKFVCPVCGSFVIHDYCILCGQKLNWNVD